MATQDRAAATPGRAPDPAYAFDLFVVSAAADREFVHGYLLPALNLPVERVLLLDGLAAGAPGVAEIDRGVTTSRFTVAVLSPAYLADRWAVFGEQLAAALDVDSPREIARDADSPRVIPLKLAACDLPLHIKASEMLDFTDRAGWDDEAALLRAWLHTPPPVPEDIPCPYPGMRPFTASDADRFFGRDDELRELVGRLARGEREIYVIGPSGSGKSSLVQAGLLHALDAGSSALGRAFAQTMMRPGDRPADRLARALAWDPAVATAAPTGPGAAIEALVARHPPAERVLVFVDQLEELFTAAGAAERDRFVAMLRALRAEPRCYLLLALRADFYGALMDSALWPDLAGRISRVEVAALRGAALATAITEPARRAGVYLEARLCDRLVADAADEPGALPLVQETLRLLWERRRQRLIGVAEYEALGAGAPGEAPRRGLDVAIARHADAAMHELGASRQDIARRVLLRLVNFGEGRADTRRQQPVSALTSAADDPTELAAVLQHLVAQRLVTVDDAAGHDAVADLAHEALITAWPALAAWVAGRRVDEQRRRQLETRVAGWIAHGRGDAGLLDRVELSEAAQWLRSDAAREVGSGAELSALVAASRAAIAEVDRQRRARTRRVIAGLAAFSVVAAALGLVEWQQRNAARRRAHEDRVRLGMAYLDEGRTLLFDDHPLRALPYLVAAREHDVEDATLGLLFERAASHTPRLTLLGHTARVRTAAFSPDGSRAVTASDDRTAWIWSTATGERTAPPLAHRDAVVSAVFSPDGTRVATASADGTARVWDAATGAPVGQPLAHGSSVYVAAFSPDGRRVVTASVDHTARVWDAATGAPITPPLVHGNIVRTAAFSADGSRVVTASLDRTARVWDAATGAPVTPPLAHDSGVWTAAFSPDGRYVVTASGDRTARIWDAATGAPFRRPLQHAGVVRGAAFTPDGADVITVSDDRTARLWNLLTGEMFGKPLEHPDGVDSAVFSADGARVATVGSDGMARIWDVRSQRLVTAIEHARPIQAAAFSRDGARLITASNDGTARIWNTAAVRLAPARDLPGEFTGAPFDPEGVRIATVRYSSTAQIWNSFTGAAITPPLAHDQVNVAAFSPDGARVITGGKTSGARVWDAWTGAPVTPWLPHYQGEVWDYQGVAKVVFSPDGRRVITAGYDLVARLWDAGTGALLAKTPPHELAIDGAAFTADGVRMVTSSGDVVQLWDAATGVPVPTPLDRPGRIAAVSRDRTRAVTVQWDRARVWDTRTWTPIAAPLEHESQIIAVALSADGRLAVTASQDRTARIWDVASGTLVAPPLPHTDAVLCAGFSPDGRRVVTGGSDRTARIWDAASGRAVLPPLEHSRSVASCVFSPDGGRVATGDDNRTLIWNITAGLASLAEWRARARCSPFVLDRGILEANPEVAAICPGAPRAR